MRLSASALIALSLCSVGSDARETDPDERVLGTATHGTLFVSGQRLMPPYVFTLVRDTLYVNDARTRPITTRELPPKIAPPSRRALAAYRLSKQVSEESRQMLARRLPDAEILKRVRARLLASGLVSEVKPCDKQHLWVWWKEPGGVELLSIMRSDLNPSPPRSVESVLTENAQELRRSLDSGGLVFVTELSTLLVPEERISEVVTTLQLRLPGLPVPFGPSSIVDTLHAPRGSFRDVRFDLEHPLPLDSLIRTRPREN